MLERVKMWNARLKERRMTSTFFGLLGYLGASWVALLGSAVLVERFLERRRARKESGGV